MTDSDAHRPCISLLTPVHNHGHFLGAAVASARVAAARAGLPIEMLIVDDGSTDDSACVARALAKRYPQEVITWSQPQAGQAAARQAALSKARGEAIILLDADDLLEPECLAEGWALLAADPRAAGAAGRAWMVGPDGERRLGLLEQRLAPWPAILDYNPLGALAAVLVRRQAVEAVGGLSFAGVPGCEDWDLWIRLVRSGATMLEAPGTWGRYRQTATSMSRQPLPMLSSALAVLDRCLAPDPRLSTGGPQPVLTAAERARLGNQRVFHTLGLLAAQRRSAASHWQQLLARLQPAPLDVGFSCTLFEWGLEFGLLAGRSVAATPDPASATLAPRAGLPLVGAALHELGCPRSAVAQLQRQLDAVLRRRRPLARLAGSLAAMWNRIAPARRAE